MTGYLSGFVFYTLAVIGVLLLAMIILKKAMAFNNFKSNEKSILKIEESLSIGFKKDLHVVRAGEEMFLIASDAERTTFLTKLATENDERMMIYESKPKETTSSHEKPFEGRSGVMISMLEKLQKMR